MLYKKGGSKGSLGLFSRHDWKQRVFVLPLSIENDENYVLTYYQEGDSKPRGRLYLEECNVIAANVDGNKSHKNSKVGFEFTLSCASGRDNFEMYAELEEDRDKWLETLKYVIEVADARRTHFETVHTCARVP